MSLYTWFFCNLKLFLKIYKKENKLNFLRYETVHLPLSLQFNLVQPTARHTVGFYLVHFVNMSLLWGAF